MSALDIARIARNADRLAGNKIADGAKVGKKLAIS